MSYLAIGAVTRALVTLLERKMNVPPLLGGITFRVSCLPPDDDRVGEESGVNLFLYRVSESPQLKNLDWRGDRARPSNGKPPLSLSLHYLLTAYARRVQAGAQDDLTAHQLLGNAMAIFNDHPVLNDVHDGEFDASLAAQFAAELRNSFEKVKVTMHQSSLEEFSKIWTGLSRAYRLSVAYEVSVVQIGPATPPEVDPPPPSLIGLDVVTMGPPIVSAIAPSRGPAGTLVTLRGGRFLLRPEGPAVLAGGVRIDAADLDRLTNDELAFRFPGDARRGPRLPVTVEADGRESSPVFFELQPWIERLRPARGPAAVPLTFDCNLVPGTSVQVEVGGVAVAAPLLSADGRSVSFTLPAALAANGPLPVTMIAGPGAGERGNSLLYEVMPRATGVTIAASLPPVQTTVTVDGERLAGREVFIQFGSLRLRAGANANPIQVRVTVDRALPPNQHVSVIVDGRESNTLPPVLDSVEPAAAFHGDIVVLNGRGLNGAVVTVQFGAAAVVIGGHGFGSRLEVAVPPGVAPGVVQLVARVDGRDSNPVPFEVLN